MSSDWFDRKQVRHAFSRAAKQYDSAATLQRAIDAHLWESMDYLEDPGFFTGKPQVIVDAGSGTGQSSKQLQARWPEATVFSVDAAMGMLEYAKPEASALERLLPKGLSNLLGRKQNAPVPVNADVRQLPFADHSVDVIYSNLCLQWVEDLQGVLNGFRRILKPGGMLLFSSFGPDTLHELRDAFAVADEAQVHVSPFANMQHWGDALIATGFRNPVLDREIMVETHQDLASLLRNLKAIGATNALQDRRRGLMGKSRLQRASDAYIRHADQQLPATWEVLYAVAWAPPADTPIRENGQDVIKIPATNIPIRKRTP